MSKQSKRRSEKRRQAKRGKNRWADNSNPLDTPIGLYNMLAQRRTIGTAVEHERQMARLKEMA